MKFVYIILLVLVLVIMVAMIAILVMTNRKVRVSPAKKPVSDEEKVLAQNFAQEEEPEPPVPPEPEPVQPQPAQEDSQTFQMVERTENIEAVREKETLERLVRVIDIQWPLARITWTQIPLRGGMLMHWAGLTKKTRTLLFVVSSDEIFRILMQTGERVREMNIVPNTDVYMMVSSSEAAAACRTQTLEYFRTNAVVPDAIIEEGCGIEQLFANGHDFALVGIGRRPCMRLAVSKNQTARKWLGTLAVEELVDPMVTSVADQAVNLVKGSMDQKKKMHMMLRRDRALDDLLDASATVHSWFYPDIRIAQKKEFYMIEINAMNGEQLDETANAILASTDQTEFKIAKIMERPGSSLAPTDTEFYKLMEKAVKESFRTDALVPVLTKGDTLWSNLTVYTFSPVYLYEREKSINAMISFYLGLIE